jgi:hypothetical protein
LRERGRHLAADEAHADDYRTAARYGFAFDRIALGHGPQIVDPGQLSSGNAQPAVPASGRYEDLLVLQLPA